LVNTRCRLRGPDWLPVYTGGHCGTRQDELSVCGVWEQGPCTACVRCRLPWCRPC
jgi:hypothetical protein